MSSDARPPRIVSMDQFRGYTVAGMLLVNYVGGMSAFHAVFKHHGTYFSYADSIMPSFFFAVGYSFRLTILRRLPQIGPVRTWLTYFRRSLALILISLMFYGLGAGDEFRNWEDYSWQNAWHLCTTLIKSDLYETLALIGVTQIFLLPFIGKSLKFRSWLVVGCLAMHALLSYFFNFNFSHAQPNAFENLLIQYVDWGAADNRCWEAGPFGVLNWSVAMLLGSIAYDIVLGNSSGKGAFKLLTLGILLMVIGYSISCLTRLYDVEKGEAGGVTAAAASEETSDEEATEDSDEGESDESGTESDSEDGTADSESEGESEEDAAETESDGEPKDDAAESEDSGDDSESEDGESEDGESEDGESEDGESEEQEKELVPVAWAAPPQDLKKFAESPVWPPLERLQGQDLESLLAEPPFVAPPEQSVRRINYWMMTKQLPSPAFILFASGFACALYALFVVACDIGPIRIGLFRTFGQNPLATYLLHTVVEHALHTISPGDAPLNYCLVSVTVFFAICYLLIRGLEKQGIYIRL